MYSRDDEKEAVLWLCMVGSEGGEGVLAEAARHQAKARRRT